MTKNTRREFAGGFKREAVSLSRGSGRPLTQVATEAGIQPQVPRRRRGPAGEAGPGVAAVVVTAERDGVRRPRRELDRARMERDVLEKKPPASSRARRDEVPVHRGSPRGIPRAGDVLGAGRRRRRLLRPARPARKRPRRGESGVGRGHPPRAGRRPTPPRRPARARRAAGRRQAGGPEPGGAPEARARHPGPGGAHISARCRSSVRSAASGSNAAGSRHARCARRFRHGALVHFGRGTRGAAADAVEQGHDGQAWPVAPALGLDRQAVRGPNALLCGTSLRDV